MHVQKELLNMNSVTTLILKLKAVNKKRRLLLIHRPVVSMILLLAMPADKVLPRQSIVYRNQIFQDVS